MNEIAKSAVSMIVGLAIMAATGCQSAQSETAPLSPVLQGGKVQQLIIKFKPHTVTCDAAGIARFASASRVPLEFVRPMSGDACIVRQSSDNPASLLEDQKRLASHPAVEWLEADRVMKAFQ